MSKMFSAGGSQEQNTAISVWPNTMCFKTNYKTEVWFCMFSVILFIHKVLFDMTLILSFSKFVLVFFVLFFFQFLHAENLIQVFKFSIYMNCN